MMGHVVMGACGDGGGSGDGGGTSNKFTDS